MGMLINGAWNPEANSITVNKKMDEFHFFVTQDGSSGFKAEEGRYHLYVSLACPWASRFSAFAIKNP